MPDTLPPCPDCGARFTYAVDALLNCPACGHEWSPDAALDAADVIRDAVGNILQDGDTVTVIKDLKSKDHPPPSRSAPRSPASGWSAAITI